MFSYIRKFLKKRNYRTNNNIITTKDKLIHELQHLRNDYLANYHYNKLIDKNCKIIDIEIASEWISIRKFKKNKDLSLISPKIDLFFIISYKQN